ncbi:MULTISPECIES: hypothetical protein [unclassified Marinovum]|uniref:hypothetical protein n=1 Tax=unclassified Marinovum TaxID=2647166 RepID=UPI003EDBED76
MHIPHPQLSAARQVVANPDRSTPLSVRQFAWETLMAARGQRCDFTRRPAGPAAVAIFDTARRARLSARIAAHCAAQGYPYGGPFGGDAA